MSLIYLAYFGTSRNMSTKGMFKCIYFSIYRNFWNMRSSFLYFSLWGKKGGTLFATCSDSTIFFLAISTGFGTLSASIPDDSLCTSTNSLPFLNVTASTWGFFSISHGRAPADLVFWLFIIYTNWLSRFLNSIRSCWLSSIIFWLSSTRFFIISVKLSSTCCGGFSGWL